MDAEDDGDDDGDRSRSRECHEREMGAGREGGAWVRGSEEREGPGLEGVKRGGEGWNE